MSGVQIQIQVEQKENKTKKKKPKRSPPSPIENKFVDRTSRGKECICLSCNQKIGAQKGTDESHVRWLVVLVVVFDDIIYKL